MKDFKFGDIVRMSKRPAASKADIDLNTKFLIVGQPSDRGFLILQNWDKEETASWWMDGSNRHCFVRVGSIFDPNSHRCRVLCPENAKMRIEEFVAGPVVPLQEIPEIPLQDITVTREETVSHKFGSSPMESAIELQKQLVNMLKALGELNK